MKEHRKFIRLIWKARVKAQANNPMKTTVATGMLKNITRDGFAFSSEDVLNVRMTYNFQLGDIQEMPIHVKGVVIRSKNFETFFHYGVHIESVRLVDRIRLNQFLAARDGKLKVRFLIYSLIAGSVVAGVVHVIFGLSLGASFGLLFGTTLLSIFSPAF